MASFFSDLGKTFQNAAKSIQKKTADGVEAGRLNSELRSLRDERTRLFASLGEAYYASHRKEDASEQLALLMRRIDELDARVKTVSDALDALDNKQRCPGCDAAVDRDAKFCPACGAKMPEPKQPEPEEGPAEAEDAPQAEEAPRPEEYCANCGALRHDQARFCAVCGRAFDASAQEAEPPRPEVEINWPEGGAEEPAQEEDSEP